MKTLLVNGSPRKDGNTAVALNEIAKTLDAHSRPQSLLKNIAAGAVPRPEPEPWQPMHFIR